MRTALWESSPGALAALLNARGPLVMADLYTITLPGGSVVRWCGSDTQITGNGNTWVLGPGIKRSRVKFTVGVSVDELSITLTDNVGTTINGRPLISFIAARGLIGARVQLDRAFWGPGALAPVGALLWFAGRVSDVPRFDRFSADISVVSDLELLNAKVPRDVYQAPCLNTLYDAACGANRAAFTVAAAATGATDSRRLAFGHALAQAAGYFDLGVVTFTSGPNLGHSRTVKQHTAGQIVALQPWPAAVSSGDAFTIYPGCDRTQTGANGCPKFHDAATVKRRFRGHPYVPVPETVL